MLGEVLYFASRCLLSAYWLQVRGPANHDQAVTDPLRKPVTLVQPYTPAQPGDTTDRIAVRCVVLAIDKQVDCGYSCDTSFKNTDPTCRRRIKLEIRRKSCREELQQFLDPLGLRCEVRSKQFTAIRKP